jgi:hypothetical protein
MANGDPIGLMTWDQGPDSGFDEWTPTTSASNTQTLDTGQSVPDGSSACVKFDSTTTGYNYLLSYIEPVDNALYYTSGQVAFWFKGTTASTSPDCIFTTRRSGATGRNIRLRITNTGALSVGFYNDAAVADVGVSLTSGWHYIQMAFDCATTTWKVTVAVDGVTYPEITSVRANTGGVDDIFIGRLYNTINTTATFYYGSVVTSDGYYITPWRWKTRVLRPVSDKNSTWTCSTGSNRYALVDDYPMDNATYIESSTALQEQQLNMGDVSLAAGESIRAIQPFFRSTTGVGTSPYVDTYVTTSGGTSDTVGLQLLTTTQSYKSEALVNWYLDPTGAAWTESVLNGCYMRLVKTNNTDTVRVTEASWRTLIKTPHISTHTATLSFTSAQARGFKKTVAAVLSFTSDQTRFAGEVLEQVLTATLSFTGQLVKYSLLRQALTATLSFTGNAVGSMWRQLQDAGGWFIKRGRLSRRRPY